MMTMMMIGTFGDGFRLRVAFAQLLLWSCCSLYRCGFLFFRVNTAKNPKNWIVLVTSATADFRWWKVKLLSNFNTGYSTTRACVVRECAETIRTEGHSIFQWGFSRKFPLQRDVSNQECQTHDIGPLNVDSVDFKWPIWANEFLLNKPICLWYGQFDRFSDKLKKAIY